MEDVKVILTGPAKVNGRWRKAGDPVTVNETVLGELRAAGVAASSPDDIAGDVKASGDIRAAIALELGKRAVTSAISERDAHWSTALDHFQTMAEDQQADAIAALEADHLAAVQALEKRAADAEKEVGDLREAIAELEAKTPDTQSGKGAVKKP